MGSKRGALAAAGIINGMGSIGPIFQEEIIGWMYKAFDQQLAADPHDAGGHVVRGHAGDRCAVDARAAGEGDAVGSDLAGEFGAKNVGDAVGGGVDHGLIGAFHHDAGERLGAGEADQDAAGVAEGTFGFARWRPARRGSGRAAAFRCMRTLTRVCG